MPGQFLGWPISTTPRNPGASTVIYGNMDELDIAFDDLEQACRFHKPEVFVCDAAWGLC